jgi:peroxiredoxin
VVAQDAKSDDPEKAKPAEAPESSAEQATQTEPEPDPFVVPDGSPGELLEYIQGLRGERPKSSDPAAVDEFRKKLMNAVLSAADKILGQQSNDEEADSAVRYKIMALNLLQQLGDEHAGSKLEKLPGELKEAGRPQLARIAQGGVLQAKVQAVQPGDTGGLKKLVEEIGDHLRGGPCAAGEFGLAMGIAQAAEQSGNGELAAKVYREFGEILVQSDDVEVASYAEKMQGAGRRLTLVGNEMKIEGVTLDGEPFRWEDYKGKVVLVDFWATWCGPCIAEMRNIREKYELYHNLGFDVVGISVDDDLDALASFVEQYEVPWSVLADNAPKPEGAIQSMGDYYGVFGIPFLVLVGTDGKVVALNPRGGQLRSELERMLGPVEEPTEEAGGS